MLNAIALGVSLLSSTALAQPLQPGRWAVLPLTNRGVDADAVAVFRDVLESELSASTNAAFVSLPRTCGDVPCAIDAGQDAGARYVAFGALGRLGQEIVVNVTIVDSIEERVFSRQRITVDRLEDLDAAAERVSMAVIRDTTTEETAQLGNITIEESRPAVRREGTGGLGLRVGGLVPIEDGYADGLPGAVIDLSYWYEASTFAIEPRLGFRFDASGALGSYLEIPMDLGAYTILGRGDFAPYLGGGAGLRYITDQRNRTFVTGDVIVTTHETISRESAFGFGLFGRAGVLLFRTYTMRVALNVDYNVTFVNINGITNPRSVTAGLGVFF
ncbi:MAG: hypothetical protein AAFV53_12405 [Myxococcota bacterium]